MFEIIEKIRHKPEGVKKQIAFGLSFLITGLILVIWISVLYPNWRASRTNEDKIAQQEPSPLGTLTQTVGTGITGIFDQIGKAKELLSSVVQSIDTGTTTPIEARTSSEGEQVPSLESLQIIATTTESVI